MARRKSDDLGAHESARGASKIRQLARYHGVQTSYGSASGERRYASRESIIAVLKALGAHVEKDEDIPDALRERRQYLWNRVVEPVALAWEGSPATVDLRFAESSLGYGVGAQLDLESGQIHSWSFDPNILPSVESSYIEGARYFVKSLSLPAVLPPGYHRLTLQTRNGHCETMIISAPVKAYSGGAENKIWGVFLPVYALHSERSWGAGDFSDFEALHEWLGQLGGHIVATLPFLAAFLDKPFEPSPYSPASRLFWNEFYIDPRRIPELQRCPEAAAMISSIEEKDLSDLRASPLVNYRAQTALRRKVLQQLSECFFQGERPASFDRFVESHPAVEDYARFRAAGERLRSPWPEWPKPLSDGVLGPQDYDEKAMRYHLYVQWVADRQIRSLADRAREIGPGLYLDLPLGVNPYSYDTWRKQSLFAEDVSAGAPPDVLFTRGQNWGFPPLHPENIREDRYGYVIEYLRHIMRQAGMMRIDHVMGLHRLFLVPKGAEATEGVYVRYAAEELYAILSVESHRNRCRIVGENLGTVPDYVNESLNRHNIMGMYVVQYELESRHPNVLRTVPSNVTASMNTHDMPPFAGFWQGVDIEDRKGIGLLNSDGAKRERKNRKTVKEKLAGFLRKKNRLVDPPSEESVLRGSLACLSSSAARIVLVNMEDLWTETNAQNLPGTSGERPNWRRKGRLGLEEFESIPEIAEILKEIALHRQERTDKEKKKGAEKRH